MIWDDVEIASRIGILIIDCRRHPLSIQCQRAKGRLDRARRAERMCVITLRSADWNFPCPIAQHFLNRHRFSTVIQLSGTGVRIDVIDLLRSEPRLVKAVRNCVCWEARVRLLASEPLLLRSRDQGLGVARRIAERMAPRLDWSAARVADEVARYESVVAETRRFR